MAGPIRHIDDAERRARLAVRHRLAPGARATTATEVARDLLALHATDPPSVILAAAARMHGPELAAIEGELYERRTLVRMLGMRRTMFVVPAELAGVVQAACTDAIAVKERRRLLGDLEQGGVADDPERWLADARAATIAALDAAGGALGADVSHMVPMLGERFAFPPDVKWAPTGAVSTRVLFLLAAEGKLVRGRPRGSWTSGQFRWMPADRWLSGATREWAPDDARVELARRWLDRFGPATVDDLRWWTGWTAGTTKRTLAAIDTVEVELDGGQRALVLDGDQAPVPVPEPWVALLPALDPTTMGWTRRDWYLGEHRPALFDRSGNAGPTVWVDGRVVGGWAQRKSGEVVVRLLEDVGSEATAAVDRAATRLAEWIAPATVTPRLRTPLERELSA